MERKLNSYLRDKREKAGFSQAELAKKLGYTSPQMISNVERDICSLPPKKFKKTAKLLKADLEKMVRLHIDDIRDHVEQEVMG